MHFRVLRELLDEISMSRPSSPRTSSSMLPDTSITIAAATPSRSGVAVVGASC
jgi:hypothetical protein